MHRKRREYAKPGGHLQGMDHLRKESEEEPRERKKKKRGDGQSKWGVMRMKEAKERRANPRGTSPKGRRITLLKAYDLKKEWRSKGKGK